MENKEMIFESEYVYLLQKLKYDYLFIKIDEGYFSQKRYSFRISFDSIKYKNLLELPYNSFNEDIFDNHFSKKKDIDPKERWKIRFKDDIDYLRDFSIFIEKVKTLAFDSKEEDEVLDGPSFFLKLGHHIKRSSVFSDYFEVGDSSYDNIKELVEEFLEKWAKDLYLPWIDSDEK